MTLSKPRRRRQWKRGKPKAFKGQNKLLRSKAIAVRVCFMVFYIPWPVFANQQGGIITFFAVWERNPRAKYYIFFLIQRCLQMLCCGCFRIVDKWRHCSDVRLIIPSEKFITKLWIFSSLENLVNSFALSSSLFKALYANSPPRLFYAQLYLVN